MEIGVVSEIAMTLVFEGKIEEAIAPIFWLVILLVRECKKFP